MAFMWCFQFTCFVWLTVQNQNILNSVSYRIKKNSKSSHLNVSKLKMCERRYLKTQKQFSIKASFRIICLPYILSFRIFIHTLIYFERCWQTKTADKTDAEKKKVVVRIEVMVLPLSPNTAIILVRRNPMSNKCV